MGKLILTTTIRYSNYVTQPRTLEMYMGLQIFKILGKDWYPYVYGWHKGICKKWKRTRDPNTNNKNIQPGYRIRIHWKICHDDNQKLEKENSKKE